MDYTTKTKKELIEICKDKKIPGYSNKNKQELIVLIQRREEDEKRTELYKKLEKEQKKIREIRLERGEQVEPIPIIRVDEYNDYEVNGIVLTRFNDKFAITEFHHCSCFYTEYDEENDHNLSLKDVIEKAKNELNNEAKFVAKFFEMILEHENELLSADELIAYLNYELIDM